MRHAMLKQHAIIEDRKLQRVHDVMQGEHGGKLQNQLLVSVNPSDEE